MKVTSKQYVKSVFEEFLDDKILENATRNLTACSESLPKLKAFLQNPQKTNAQKTQEMQSWGMEQKTINFLFLLSKNNDLDKLPMIVMKIKEQNNNLTNIMEVTVTSSHELENEEKDKIKEVLFKKFGKKIKLKTKITPEIVGGLILHIGSSMIDDSIKNRIDKLKKELLISS